MLWFFVLTRFLYANRYPLGSKNALTGRDGVLIHQYFGIRLVPGIVVDRAESRLDPAAFGDARRQGRWIKVTPGLEPLHDPNSDQDDRGCKQKQKRDHDDAFRKPDRLPHLIHPRPLGQAAACCASRAVTPLRMNGFPRLASPWNSPARSLRIDFGRARCTNAE
jgi:hypothetical protein